MLHRLFRVRIRLGHFDPDGALQSIGPDQVCMPSSLELARDGARQSIVLLKNVAGLLPLSLSQWTGSSVLMVGPNTNLSDVKGYYGSKQACGNSNDTPLSALQQWLPGASSIKGVPSVGSNDTSGVAAAAAAAATADLIFLAIGSDRTLEEEGSDRVSIDFSVGQHALIAAVTAAAKCPVIALVFSGGAMDVSALLSNPAIVGVFHAGQPSVQVVGLGDLLFGATLDGRPVVPAARMSQMIYSASYVNEVSMFDFGMRPGVSAWPPGTNPGRTHRFYTGTPVVPFGFGLSYTTWVYTPIPGPTPPTTSTSLFASVEAAAEAEAARGVIGHIPAALKTFAADFFVNVTNTGTRDADDVVLGFLVPPGAGQGGVPLQELFGFERVFVPAGQTVTVYLGAQGVSFTQAGVDGVRRFAKGTYRVVFGVKESEALGMGFAETTLEVS